VNTSITELNLSKNKLDAEAGKALGKALEVSLIFVVKKKTMTPNTVFFLFLFLSWISMQVNTTLASLHLLGNELGLEGGKAIAKSLEVTFPLCCHEKLSMTPNTFVFVFVLDFDAGEHEPHVSEFEKEQIGPRRRKGARQESSGHSCISVSAKKTP
jgi:hypothetical protein